MATALLHGFRKKQEQRAQAYSEFNTFFKAYLLDRDVKTYQSLCKGITAKFAAIGKEIIAIEDALLKLGKKDWAASIRRVQELEREKLQLTAKTQMVQARCRAMRDAEAAGVPRSSQLPVLEREVSIQRKAMGELIERINEELEEIRYVVFGQAGEGGEKQQSSSQGRRSGRQADEVRAGKKAARAPIGEAAARA